MNPHPPVRPTRRTRVVILAAFIAALLSTQLTASIFHFGTYTVGDVKQYLTEHGVPETVGA